jgi:CRP/FNR family transcriptional regulator
MECDKRTPLFNRLTIDDFKILNENRYEVKFKDGEIIFKQGMPFNHLISVTSGLVKLYIEGISDKIIILELVKPWEVFGGPGIYVDNRYHYSAMAVGDVTTCFIDSNKIKKLIRKNPDFAEDFIRGCSSRNAQMFERMVSLTQKQMHGRIADALIYMKNVFGENRFEMRVSKQDIADLTAMTKDSALRILKEFQADNIILSQNGTMEIKDEEKLREISIHG